MIRLPEEEREKFITELNSPLEGESAAELQVSQQTVDNELEAFDALMGMTSGR